MQILIDIPEKTNNRIRSFLGHGYCLWNEDVKVIAKAVYNGQPEPKNGKWIVHPEVKNVYGGTYIECSQCGEKYVVQHMEDEKYCRNCGAKMEK